MCDLYLILIVIFHSKMLDMPTSLSHKCYFVIFFLLMSMGITCSTTMKSDDIFSLDFILNCLVCFANYVFSCIDQIKLSECLIHCYIYLFCFINVIEENHIFL